MGIYKIASRGFIFLVGVLCVQGSIDRVYASAGLHTQSAYHARSADDFAIALSEKPEYGELLELFVDIQGARAEQASIKVLRPKVHTLIRRIQFVQKYAQDPLLSDLLAWCYAQKGCGKRRLAAWHKALITVAAVAVLAGSAFAVGRKLDSGRLLSRTPDVSTMAAGSRGLTRGHVEQERDAVQPFAVPVLAPRVATAEELIAGLDQAYEYEDDINSLYHYRRETFQPVCRSCRQPFVCGDSVIIALPRAGYADLFAEGVHKMCGLLWDRWMDGMRRRPQNYRRYEVPLRECNLELYGRSLPATASGSDRGLLRTERGDVFYLQTLNGASGSAWHQTFEQSLPGDIFDYCVRGFDVATTPESTIVFDSHPYHKYARLSNIDSSVRDGRQFWIYKRPTLAPTTGGATAGAGEGAVNGAGASSERRGVGVPPSTASHTGRLPLYELGRPQTVTTSGVQPRVGSLFATQAGQQALCVGSSSESVSLYVPANLTYSYQILHRNLDGDLSDYQVRSYGLSDTAPLSIAHHGDDYDAYASLSDPRGEYTGKLVRIYRRRVPASVAGGAPAGTGVEAGAGAPVVSTHVKELNKRPFIPLSERVYDVWVSNSFNRSYVNEPDVAVSWPLQNRSFLTMILDGQPKCIYIFDAANFFLITPDDQLEGSMSDYKIIELGEREPAGYSLYAQFGANKQDRTTSTFFIYRRNGS